MQFLLEKLFVKLFLVKSVLAQNNLFQPSGQTSPTQPVLNDPLKNKGITDILKNISDFILKDVAIPLAAVMIIVGALQMVFSGGNPETFRKGQKTIIYAVIGFFIVLIASGVVNLIKKIVTGS